MWKNILEFLTIQLLHGILYSSWDIFSVNFKIMFHNDKLMISNYFKLFLLFLTIVTNIRI